MKYLAVFGGGVWRGIRGRNKRILLKELPPYSLMIHSFSAEKKYQRLKIRVYENKAGILGERQNFAVGSAECVKKS